MNVPMGPYERFAVFDAIHHLVLMRYIRQKISMIINALIVQTAFAGKF